MSIDDEPQELAFYCARYVLSVTRDQRRLLAEGQPGLARVYRFPRLQAGL